MSAEYDFKGSYLNWLQSNIEQFKINDFTFRLTLPFLNRDNDYTEIYIIKRDDNNFLITDDGITIGDLELSGFDPFSSERRKKIFNSIITAHGVSKTQNNELIIECTLDDLALKKHMLVQCMVKISDMFYLSRKNIQSLFLEDVQDFLNIHKIRYVENTGIIGKSKLSTHYDFIIPHSEKAPERLIQVINHLDLTTAKTVIFSWNDTKNVRKPDSKLYTFIQDTQRNISKSSLNILKEYDIYPALWSKKDKYINELSA